MGNTYYANTIHFLKRQIKEREKLQKELSELQDKLIEAQQNYIDLIDAQKLLSIVSEDNTKTILDYITAIINKTLSEIFPNDVRRVYLKKKLHANRPHINLELVNGDNRVLDIQFQAGTGLCQVVSVLFSICLIEIRKGRRLVILDEKLNGLHRKAKLVVEEILKMFAEAGFQFIMVEYGMNDLGKIYNIEMRGNEAKAFPLGTEEKYDETEIFIFTKDVDLGVLDKEYKENEVDEYYESQVG